jgi:hypothetical protein
MHTCWPAAARWLHSCGCTQHAWWLCATVKHVIRPHDLVVGCRPMVGESSTMSAHVFAQSLPELRTMRQRAYGCDRHAKCTPRSILHGTKPLHGAPHMLRLAASASVECNWLRISSECNCRVQPYAVQTGAVLRPSREEPSWQSCRTHMKVFYIFCVSGEPCCAAGCDCDSHAALCAG